MAIASNKHLVSLIGLILSVSTVTSLMLPHKFCLFWFFCSKNARYDDSPVLAVELDVEELTNNDKRDKQ